MLSARRSIVTVEEVVDEFEPHPFQIVLPSVAVGAIAVVPGGAHPSYAHDYYPRDNAFYEAWDSTSRDRETFRKWIERHVMGTEDFGEYLQSVTQEEVGQR